MNSESPKYDASRRRLRSGQRCEIQLQNPCRYPEAGARRVRPWLTPLIEDLAPGTDSFVVRFVSDREMRRLNSSFRRRDEPTDVLSFPSLPSPRKGALQPAYAGATDITAPELPHQERHLGDVVISVPTARRQADRLGHSVDVELRILLLHGVLHCLGHDHETDGGVMNRLERSLRRRYVDHG